MELVFRILAVILIGIAAYFLWTGDGENAFISAVLGSVSFFLSVRFQIKGRLPDRVPVENEEFTEPEPHLEDSSQLSDSFPDSAEPFIDGRPATGDKRKASL